ncbi:MAG: phosphoribosylformylglycinamidine synthase subunit PurQ [Phycisphaeraceae bacterium]|nr:phosphoribosylformylglycinamidine synthase subunit PurQ [Phycisphaeraceae bacterium]MCW5754992.1 phosphoribosylformylglycinamidine synthase subunit PurQ [Phycisphaeraceae bacterium]
MVKALVIRAAGTNCDHEVMRGFELAGAKAERVHLNRLIEEPQRIDDFDIIMLPGGFAHGDDIASGRIFAMHLRERLYEPLYRAVARGACIGGICNGFQVLVQVGLVPGPLEGERLSSEAPPPQRLSLTVNQHARYMDCWTPMMIESASRCVWTRGLEEYPAETMRFPSGHGEGRLAADSEATLDALERHGQVALRYGENFNGSARAIAGVCDLSGRIFGMMPHPDRFLDWNRHPFWTRLPRSVRRGPTPGLRLFLNGVEAASRATVG